MCTCARHGSGMCSLHSKISRNKCPLRDGDVHPQPNRTVAMPKGAPHVSRIPKAGTTVSIRNRTTPYIVISGIPVLHKGDWYIGLNRMDGEGPPLFRPLNILTSAPREYNAKGMNTYSMAQIQKAMEDVDLSDSIGDQLEISLRRSINGRC